MNRNRKTRRERLEKEKTKAKKFFKEIWHDEEFVNDEKWIGKHANTRVPCSCWMCGNIRRQKVKQKDKLTLQEKRELEREHDDEQI